MASTTGNRLTTIERGLTFLHPIFLSAVEEVVRQLKDDGLPLQVFESYRCPARQNYLYQQGRGGKPGKKVTNSQAWESFHQYGLAVDFALFLDGKWTWDGGRQFSQCWSHLRDVGEFYGLAGLDSEQAHLQMSGVELHELQQARFPSGGNKAWWDNLRLSALEWKGRPPAPVIIQPPPSQPMEKSA